MRRRSLLFPALVLFVPATLAAQQVVGGCSVLPIGNIWNTPVDHLPMAANSAAVIGHIGSGEAMHPDFGTVWEGAPIGIPYVVVPNGQTMVPTNYSQLGGWPNQSDPGPYPIPVNAPIEGGDDPDNDGDRQLTADRDSGENRASQSSNRPTA